MFPGPPSGSQAREADAAATRARELGLLEEVVFFNDRKPRYAERGDWLLAADCALVLHRDQIEARYAFRTRMLDCFWAGLPVVCSHGDELAERVAVERLGETVAPGDAQAAALALERVLERGRGAFREPLAAAAASFAWASVTAPLERYVQALPPARPRSRSRLPPAQRLRAGATRAARGAWALRRRSET
jgi:glycosyltransferase involved in cell wall biosynthesis